MYASECWRDHNRVADIHKLKFPSYLGGNGRTKNVCCIFTVQMPTHFICSISLAQLIYLGTSLIFY